MDEGVGGFPRLSTLPYAVSAARMSSSFESLAGLAMGTLSGGGRAIVGD